MENDIGKKIACIGAGYVGGCTMAIMALKCPSNKYYVYDQNKSLINKWNSTIPPIHEKNLSDILAQVRGINLIFTQEYEEAIHDSDLIFISVNTSFDYETLCPEINNITSVIDELGNYFQRKNRTKSLVIVEKSTVPVRTSKYVLDSLKKLCDFQISVISNPEFLAEGSAIQDLLYPNRIIIGGLSVFNIGENSESEKEALRKLKEIYLTWIPEEKIITMNKYSAELTKLAANAFLAQRISSINSLTSICEKVNASISDVHKGLSSDPRIGSKYLNCSYGFGGACLEKDTLMLVYLCEYLELKMEANYWRQVILMNNYQKTRFFFKIVYFCLEKKSEFENLKGARLSIFGATFKKGTDDVRNSPAIYIIQSLLEEGAILSLFDPYANIARLEIELTNKGISLENFEYSKNPQDSVIDSKAIIILTELEEFKCLDYYELGKLMKEKPLIFDGRNIIEQEIMEKAGFTIYSIGNG